MLRLVRRRAEDASLWVLVDRAEAQRRPNDFGAGDPTFAIDGVIAHHLKILRLARGWRLGI